MKKICCEPGSLNKVFVHRIWRFWFIGVHLVHLYGQLTKFSGFAMNQMNLNVLLCCLWQKICLVPYSVPGAMNLESCRFIGVHREGARRLS